eukprot:scaffold71450_cov46-Phaeocystis_antarctica.AAC.2
MERTGWDGGGAGPASSGKWAACMCVDTRCGCGCVSARVRVGVGFRPMCVYDCKSTSSPRAQGKYY